MAANGGKAKRSQAVSKKSLCWWASEITYLQDSAVTRVSREYTTLIPEEGDMQGTRIYLIIKNTIRSVDVLSFLDQFLSIRLHDIT